MNPPSQIVIVGGGVFGACAAYELAKAGLAVTLVERDPIGSHASGKNPGNLNPILAAPPKLQPLALDSFRLHQTLQQELAQLGCRDYQFEAVRRILVCYNETDRLNLIPIQQSFQQQPGFSARWLEAQALRQIEPRLSPSVESGLLLEGNRSLDAYAFNHAVVEGAQKLGARLVSADVKLVTPIAAGYRVSTDQGELDCEILVLANGPWVDGVREWLGIELPVEPVKGEMLRMRLAGRNITHDFTQGMISLYRRGDDEVWVGVTREHQGFDEQPSAAGKQLLLDSAAKILPTIADAQLLEHLASLRPMAPGGLPLIGAVPGHSNLYIANGGGIKGILLCAAVGNAIRDLIMDGATALPIAEFNLH